jgi:hypothetical protein
MKTDILAAAIGLAVVCVSDFFLGIYRLGFWVLLCHNTLWMFYSVLVFCAIVRHLVVRDLKRRKQCGR